MIKIKNFFAKVLSGAIAQTTIKTSTVLVVRLMIQTGTLLLLAKLLGAAQFGEFAAVTSVAVLMGILSLTGMNLVLLKDASHNNEKAQHTLSYALPCIFISSTLLLILFWLIGLHFFNARGSDILSILAVGISEIFLFPLLLIISTYHQANNKIILSQVLTMIPLLARLLSVLVIFTIDSPDPLRILFLSYFLTGLFSLLIAYKSQKTIWPAINSWRYPSAQELKNSSKYSALNFLSLALGELDKTFTYHLLQENSAGIYAAGTRIIGAITLPISALIITSLPRLFQKDEQNKKLIKNIFITTWVYAFLAILGVCLFSNILEKLFVTSFTGLAACLMLMTLAIPAMVFRMTAGNILMTLDMVNARLCYETIGIVLMIGLLMILGRPFGINGAIASLVIAEATMAAIGWSVVISQVRK
jgi:O-antigen/teichoic acid export membrane protein